MVRLGLKGAIASRSSGVDADWNLEDYADAKRWLHEIARLVLGKRITAQQAQAAIRALEAWLKAEGDRLTAHVVDDLKAEVERLKAEVGKGSSLRAIG